MSSQHSTFLEQQEIAIYSKLAEKLVAIEVKYNTHKKALQESTNEVTLEEFDRVSYFEIIKINSTEP